METLEAAQQRIIELENIMVFRSQKYLEQDVKIIELESDIKRLKNIIKKAGLDNKG